MKKNIFYYIKPKNLEGEITGYGYVFNLKKTLVTFGITFLLTIILGIIFNLQWMYIAAMCAIDLLFLPKIISNTYKYMYEQRRFFDLNEYMEQFLYSFRTKGKVYAALEETREIFKEGEPMYETIDNALKKAASLDNKSSSLSMSEIAFKEIEASYQCQKLKSIHKFALKAERIGGDYTSTIEMLQNDRKNWEERNTTSQNTKRKRKNELVASSVTVFLLCEIFMKILTITSSKAELLSVLNISHNLFVQISTVLLWLVSFITYIKADDIIAVNWLNPKNKYDDKSVLKTYNKIINWNESAELRKSIKYACCTGILGIVLLIISVFLKITVLKFIALIICLLAIPMLFQHKIDYKLARKKVILEIEKAFPNWLIEIALLLQTTNVSNAIRQSFDSAPAILKPELVKLYNSILENPHSSEPFVLFMREVDIRSITSAMKMLYSLKSGISNDYNEQIRDILEKNNEMLNRSEEIRLNEEITLLKAMMAIPYMSGGAKLAVDMIVFFFTSFATMGNLV